MNYLLDTCVLSELVKKNPSPKVKQWINYHNELSFFISVISIGELLKGIYKLDEHSVRKIELYTWVNNELLVRFEHRIIELDIKIMTIWGKLTGETEKQGKKLPILDSLIAATAINHSLVWVTRNTTDFLHCDVTIENPFETSL